MMKIIPEIRCAH